MLIDGIWGIRQGLDKLGRSDMPMFAMEFEVDHMDLDPDVPGGAHGVDEDLLALLLGLRSMEPQ